MISQAWKPSTIKKYEGAWKRWVAFCVSRNANPGDPPSVGLFTDFLLEQQSKNCSYSYLASTKSTLVAWLPNGKELSNNIAVKRFMEAAYKLNPPRVRYPNTWDIDPVIKALDVPNAELSLLNLSIKTFALTALSSMGRTSDLRALAANNYLVARDDQGTITSLDLIRLRLPKQQRSGALTPLRLYAAPEGQDNICPVKTCLAYIEKTRSLRHADTPELFVSSRTPHKAIASKTAARWLLTAMERGGVDTSLFKAHSTCGAAASSKVKAGASLQSLLNSGRWNTESTIKTFYLRTV